MKKILALVALSATSMLASAQSFSTPSTPVRFFAGGGLTYGGDRLATVPFNSSSDDTVRAGGLIAARLGADIRLADSLSLQLAGGYHIHSTRYRHDAAARFSRYPLEALLNVGITDRVRIGAGVRHVVNPKLVGRGVTDTTYENATGAIVSGEYFFNAHLGVSVRGVLERYQPEAGGSKVSGDHLGVFAHYYF